MGAALNTSTGAYSREPVFGAEQGEGFCVRTVREDTAIDFQWVFADGRCIDAPAKPSTSTATVRDSRLAEPLASLAFCECADGADDVDAGVPSVSGASGVPLPMRIIRVRARPSRSKLISMPILRRKVAARRSRPDSARGLWGQSLDFAIRAPAASWSSSRRSAAVPIHSVASPSRPAPRRRPVAEDSTRFIEAARHLRGSSSHRRSKNAGSNCAKSEHSVHHRCESASPLELPDISFGQSRQWMQA